MTGATASPPGVVLQTQGSFLFGGDVITAENGDTLHGDHGYAQYQVPAPARRLPLVMWHGGRQYGKTWESTPDGRDGFQNIFLRRGWTTYIVDQPRRGRAGQSLESQQIVPALSRPDGVGESLLFNVFRLGTWVPPDPPEFFPGVQFSQSPDALEQYWRQSTPDTGPRTNDERDLEIRAGAGVRLLERVGPAVLLTHSSGGRYGWDMCIRSRNVRAIVSYEPARFLFASDDPPADVPTADPFVQVFTAPVLVPPEKLMELTRIPIQIVFGDNIDKHRPSTNTGVEHWRVVWARAHQFQEAVNRRGGNVSIVELPEHGIHGNTHFPFSDLNNIEIADLLSAFLREKGLDDY